MWYTYELHKTAKVYNLSLFNGTICLPQIVAALCGGSILKLIGSHQSSMMYVAGIFFIIGSCCVAIIGNEKKKQLKDS